MEREDKKQQTNFRLGSKDLSKYKKVCGIYKISARYSKIIAYKNFFGCSTNIYTRFTHIKHTLSNGNFTNKQIQDMFNNGIVLVFELVEVCSKSDISKKLLEYTNKVNAIRRKKFKRNSSTSYQNKKTKYSNDTLPPSIKDKKYIFENYNGMIENLTLIEMVNKHNIEINSLISLIRRDKTDVNNWYLLGGKKQLYTLTNIKTGNINYNLTSFRLSNTKTLSRCQISKLLSGKIENAKGYTLTLQNDFIKNN